MKTRILALGFSLLRLTVALSCLFAVDLSENPTAGMFLIAEIFSDIQSCINVAVAQRFDTRARGLVVPLCYAASAFIQPTSGPDQSELLAGLVGMFAVSELLLRSSFGWCCTSASSSWYKLHDAFPYSIIRHPMALNGMMLRALVTCAYPTTPNVIVCGLAFVLTLWRLRVEEQFLSTVEEWRGYSLRVPYKLIPGVY